jgi:UDP-N-acetylglucosamine 2-epimerase (non-hydrolysing)
MKTIMTITGIRPDFIRMSEIFKKLDSQDWCNHILVHTGQHYDSLLSDIFFTDLEIRKPDYNLKIGGKNKKHYHQQAELGVKILDLIHEHDLKPDLILFLGDSNSVLASVPLKKEGYKIGHIEAGMRSYDIRMLEEINRKVCDHVSDFLFVYHENYKQKAIREGICPSKIFVVGNTIVEPLSAISAQLGDFEKSHILMDIHRPENFKSKNRMKNILKFANECSSKFNKPVKMLNFGRTMQYLEAYNAELGNIEVIDLMGYKDFVRFMKQSEFIISDSGTAQEEPALLKIPVVVPRDYTERPESVENNNSFMLDVNSTNHFEKAYDWICKNEESHSSWLGDGNTSINIIKLIKENYYV